MITIPRIVAYIAAIGAIITEMYVNAWSKKSNINLNKNVMNGRGLSIFSMSRKAYPTKEKQRSETLNRVMATAFEAIAIALFNL